MDTGNELAKTFRLGLVDWYDFRPDSAVLYIGKEGDAIPASLARRDVSVVCASVEESMREDWQSEHGNAFAYLICVADLECCRNPEEVIAARGYDPLRDVENTPDSVFCSHGAGFIVPWDEAPARMHLHPDVIPGAPAGSASAPSAPVRAAFRGTAEEDQELQAIFERTYGKQKPRVGGAETRTSRPTVNGQVFELEPPKTEYLLVDGYNIIFAWPDLKEQARHSLEDARKSLIDILSNYHGFHPCELILVFDAYRVQGSLGAQEETQGIHVVYTKEAETADNYIEKTIRQIARKRDSRIRVATSDGLEQVIILGGGAERVPAQELRREVEQTRVEIAAILDRNNLHPKETSAVALAMREALKEKERGKA